MVGEDIASSFTEIISQLGGIWLWLKTLGIIVVLWIIFQVIAFLLNRKKMKIIKSIKEDLRRIENKLDKVSKKH